MRWPSRSRWSCGSTAGRWPSRCAPPAHDVELAHGFLLTEGVITAAGELAAARYCDSVDDTGANTYNVLDVTLAPGVAPPAAGVERNFYTTSSCGVCGKASLDAVRLRTRFPPAGDSVRVDAETLYGLPDALRSAQRLFDSTGRPARRRACSPRTARRSWSARTWGGTTPSTRCSAGRC